jgi:hypothetical protein
MATQDLLQSTQDLLKRVETEGVTQGNQTLLQPGAYNASTGEIKIPNQEQINPDISTAQGRTSYYQQFIADEEARAVKAEADRQQAIKDREAQRTKQGGILDLLKGVGQKRTEELGALGFDPTQQFAQQKAQLAEVDSLYEDYNKTVAMRDQQIADIQGRTGGTIDFANAETAKINRNANVVLTQKSSNINSKLAVMEAQNNNWENAQKFVNQAITDYTAGLTADYNMIQSFIDDNNDLISSLGTEYTNALNSRKALILDQINQAATDKQNEINNELNKYKAVTDRMQQERLGAEQITTPTNWTDLQIKSAIDGILAANPNASYEEVLQEINSDTTILNKDRAIQIAKDRFGVKETATTQPKAISNPQAKSFGQNVKSTSAYLQTLGGRPEIIGGTIVKSAQAIGSFFSGLFGR